MGPHPEGNGIHWKFVRKGNNRFLFVWKGGLKGRYIQPPGITQRPAEGDQLEVLH